MAIRHRFAVLVLVLVMFGWAAALVHGTPGAVVGPARSTPTPTAPPAAAVPAGAARGVADALDRVQRAFNAGDVALLCRPGALVDPAVIRQQDAQSGGCEGEVETLIGGRPSMRLELLSPGVRGDLAAATVKTARGATARVDLLRTGGRWLLSFSQADDPLPALAGVG